MTKYSVVEYTLCGNCFDNAHAGIFYNLQTTTSNEDFFNSFISISECLELVENHEYVFSQRSSYVAVFKSLATYICVTRRERIIDVKG